jgi:Alpha 1,4-glycosyltransferase conserved region
MGGRNLKLFSFWSFTPLTYIERLCLASMLSVGHRVDVFTYDRDLAAPSGVTVRDAAEILPQKSVVRHVKSGSPALFSDLFRYEGLRRGEGIWVDLDVFLLRDLNGMADHVFGWERHDSINTAVLRFPSDSTCLVQIIEYCRAPTIIAPFWPRQKRAKQFLRSLVGAQKPPERLEWGILGPKVVTHFVKHNRLLHHAQPTDVFYPVNDNEANRCFHPDGRVEATFTSSTRAVHLWNTKIRGHKKAPPPPGSFIARMCEKLGVEAA